MPPDPSTLYSARSHDFHPRRALLAEHGNRPPLLVSVSSSLSHEDVDHACEQIVAFCAG